MKLRFVLDVDVPDEPELTPELRESIWERLHMAGSFLDIGVYAEAPEVLSFEEVPHGDPAQTQGVSADQAAHS